MLSGDLSVVWFFLADAYIKEELTGCGPKRSDASGSAHCFVLIFSEVHTQARLVEAAASRQPI